MCLGVPGTGANGQRTGCYQRNSRLFVLRLLRVRAVCLPHQWLLWSGLFLGGIFLGVGPWANWGYSHGWGGHRFSGAGGGRYVADTGTAEAAARRECGQVMAARPAVVHRMFAAARSSSHGSSHAVASRRGGSKS